VTRTDSRSSPLPCSTRPPRLIEAWQITLDKPVRDIQGCDFATGTLFPELRPLLQVDLPHKLDGQPVTGTVKSLFALLQRSVCTGASEAEGVDYDAHSGTLRAEVIPPGVCAAATAVYSYGQVTG
jgi:hypothetical protein